MKIRFHFLFLIGLLKTQMGFGQISPPGLGNTNLATWGAIAFRQSLDTTSQKQSVTYIGYARISDPDNYDAFQKPAILILNEEFYHQFNKNWQYSVALSYRRQREYIDVFPYTEDVPSVKQEFRIYSRFSYIRINPRIKLAATFRQEFRKFFAPDFLNWNESFQFRSRLRCQLAINLDQKKIHKLIFSAEPLFAISRTIDPTKEWSKFSYKESRFCIYYSIDLKKSPFIFNVGYMNNLVGIKNAYSGHYIAIDVIWENPLNLFKSKKGNHVEGLE